jgi:ATP-binding cassette subfamily B protein
VDAHWRYLGGTIKEQRAGVVGAVISGLSWQGSAIVAPLLIRHAIDAGIRAHDRTQLVVSAVGIVGLGIGEAVAGAMRHYFAIRNRGRGQASVRDRIFHHVLELDAGYHDRVGAG